MIFNCKNNDFSKNKKEETNYPTFSFFRGDLKSSSMQVENKLTK